MTDPLKVMTSRTSFPITLCATNLSKLAVIQFVPDPESSKTLTLKDLSVLFLKRIMIVGERDMSALLELITWLFTGFTMLFEATVVLEIKPLLFTFIKCLSLCTLESAVCCNCHDGIPALHNPVR